MLGAGTWIAKLSNSDPSELSYVPLRILKEQDRQMTALDIPKLTLRRSALG